VRLACPKKRETRQRKSLWEQRESLWEQRESLWEQRESLWEPGKKGESGGTGLEVRA